MDDIQRESDRIALLEATDQTYSTCDIMNGNPCIPCQRTFGLDAQIATARKAITDAQDLLSRLLKDKHALRAERNQLHDAIVRQLPPELISKIFEACVDNREPSSSQWELSYSTCAPHTVSPLVLGSVCQEWNHIAWTSPSLWTHIYIRSYGWRRDTYIEGVERWLQRSGSLSLCIFLELPAVTLKEDNPALVRLIDVIKQHAGQWRSLYMSGLPSFDLKLLFCNLSYTRLRLRNLSIGIKYRHSWNIFEHGVELTELYPSRLRLQNVNLDDINIRWSDITDIDLVGVLRLNECVELLRKTPQLVKCRFDVIADPVEGWRTSASLFEHTVHYSLRELYLQRYFGTDIEMFLQHFSFPNLRHLSLVKCTDPNLLSAVTSLLGRSSPPLSFLRIREVDFGSSEMIDLLQNAPSLVRLDLLQHVIPTFDPQTNEGGPLLTALVDVFNHHLSLPKLETIFFQVNREFIWSPASWELIARLCEASSLKNIIGKTLKHVSIIGGRGRRRKSGICDDTNILSRLVEISQSGVTLQVYDIGGNDLLRLSIDKLKSLL